jgi:hypothetical protein
VQFERIVFYVGAIILGYVQWGAIAYLVERRTRKNRQGWSMKFSQKIALLTVCSLFLPLVIILGGGFLSPSRHPQIGYIYHLSYWLVGIIVLINSIYFIFCIVHEVMNKITKAAEETDNYALVYASVALAISLIGFVYWTFQTLAANAVG